MQVQVGILAPQRALWVLRFVFLLWSDMACPEHHLHLVESKDMIGGMKVIFSQRIGSVYD